MVRPGGLARPAALHFITGRVPVRSALSVVIAPDRSKRTSAGYRPWPRFQKERLPDLFLGKWHLGDTIDAMPVDRGFDTMKDFLAYYSGVYAYTDTNLHPDFPRDDPQFIAAYWRKVNDGMWEGEPAAPRRVVEHFGYPDLATIDREAGCRRRRLHQRTRWQLKADVHVRRLHKNPATRPIPRLTSRTVSCRPLSELAHGDGRELRHRLAGVAQRGIDKNTIVLWTVDNGAWIDAYPDAGYQPFRGMKGTGFEGGWRVPTIMSWPGRIPAGRKDGRHHLPHGLLADRRRTGRPDAATPWCLGGQRRQADLFRRHRRSGFVLGKGPSARTSMIYIEGITMLGLRTGD